MNSGRPVIRVEFDPHALEELFLALDGNMEIFARCKLFHNHEEWPEHCDGLPPKDADALDRAYSAIQKARA